MSKPAARAGKGRTAPGVYQVAVLGKALDVLETLARGPALGLSEVSSRAGVSKPSAFRILTTLETRAYRARDAVSRAYLPGPRLIALSCAIVSGLNLVQHARPVMEALRAEFGETVNLHPRVKRAVAIDVLLGPRCGGRRRIVAVSPGGEGRRSRLGAPVTAGFAALRDHRIDPGRLERDGFLDGRRGPGLERHTTSGGPGLAAAGGGDPSPRRSRVRSRC